MIVGTLRFKLPEVVTVSAASETRIAATYLTALEPPTNQAGTLVDSIEENQEESSDSEQNPDDISEEGDEPSVSTKPWTRSQGPPPALVGTQSLSRYSLNSPPFLLQELGGATKTEPKGFTGRLVGWASSMWEEFHPW